MAQYLLDPKAVRPRALRHLVAIRKAFLSRSQGWQRIHQTFYLSGLSGYVAKFYAL